MQNARQNAYAVYASGVSVYYRSLCTWYQNLCTTNAHSLWSIIYGTCAFKIISMVVKWYAIQTGRSVNLSWTSPFKIGRYSVWLVHLSNKLFKFFIYTRKSIRNVVENKNKIWTDGESNKLVNGQIQSNLTIDR